MDSSKPTVSSVTIQDWGVKSAGKALDTSAAELILKAVTACFARGEAVELCSFSSAAPAEEGDVVISDETGHPISARRLMLFKPSDVAEPMLTKGGMLQLDPASWPDSKSYDVVKLDGTAAHVVVAPTADAIPMTADDIVSRTITRVVERATAIVNTSMRELSEKNIDLLVKMLIADDPIAETRRAIEIDNAEQRTRFFKDIDCLNSKQVALIAGHSAANTSVTGSRWKQQRRVFSVPFSGNELFPEFQFRDGQPRPVIAKILQELPETMTPWQTAFWFVASNSWLRGKSPAESLDDEAAVVEAARRESEPIIG